MYFFDKKVVYLVWNIQEGQARGIGTAKLLAMDAVCRIEINITGCGRVQGTYPVYVLSGDMKSLLGEIILNKGRGNLLIKCNANALGHRGFPYTKVTGIHIDLKAEGSLTQKWLPFPPDEKDEKEQEFAMPVERAFEKEIRDAVTEVGDEVTEEKSQPPEKDSFKLHSNKWQQLCAIYPIVHPFHDGRAYLSIEPRDFVVLQERFQPMVQNSFLLHGFYHYRHLLLGRTRQVKNVQYYLGVPGVFYEKEKAAALFYGFESFESAVTPAKEGDFGYYMKRVQI